LTRCVTRLIRGHRCVSCRASAFCTRGVTIECALGPERVRRPGGA
jgi:hypothetical protein